ncbi:MAG: HD domain-containing phosphohydrolase, partial [Thermodesulfobacteriota bacterium]
DGSGYPDGLRGDEIPQASRIIHLVDAFDAMATDRPYRKALSRQEVLARLHKGRGTQFDPDLVKLFLQIEEEGQIDAISREVAELNV